MGDKDTGSFRPKSFITRQEVAAVLKKEREKDETVSGPGFPKWMPGLFLFHQERCKIGIFGLMCIFP